MTGFENENDFIEQLNNKSFKELNDNLKRLILKVNSGIEPKVIFANKIAGIDKADISIKLDDKEYLVSLKKGSGNSVHQEPIENFINYLKNNFENNEVVFNNLRHFIWGDKSLDGSGKIENRIGAPQYKKEYPEKVFSIQNYFDIYSKELLERFILTGAVSKSKAEYLIYGDVNNCEIVSKENLMKFAITSIKHPISIGCLTFQAWNRNINGGIKSEKKRGQIQLKWGSLKDDIKKI